MKHQVLNAKHHKREAEIVAQAGRKGAVTIATNMAGRGTDIILGGNPEAMAWAQLQEKYPTRLEVPPEQWDALVNEIEAREQTKAEGRVVAAMGGLHIIGSERHEARRIDLQLRGRCGRQGDPGSSRFYLSLEDDLMRIFAGEWVKNVLTRLGMQEGEAIESRMVSRRIEGPRKKSKSAISKPAKTSSNTTRSWTSSGKRVYGYRQRILDGANCKQLILDMIGQQVDRHLSSASPATTARNRSRSGRARSWASSSTPATSAAWTSPPPSDTPWTRPSGSAEGQVHDAIEENLPEEAERRNGTGRPWRSRPTPAGGSQPARPRSEAGRPRAASASSSSRSPARPSARST